MMKNVFAKIFLWFFGAQLVIGTVLFAVSSWQYSNTLPPPVQATLSQELHWRIEMALLLEKNHQLETLIATVNQFSIKNTSPEFQTRTAFFERTSKGNFRSVGQPVRLSPAFADLATQAAQAPSKQFFPLQTSGSWGGAIAGHLSNGRTLIIVQETPRGRPFWSLWDEVRTAEGRFRLLVTLPFIALVCYGLARYITTPIARLRAATQKLAAGDLKTRVAFKSRGGDELVALGHDFDLMAARLQQGVEAERQLLGDISHELRSPLARLGVALDLVEQKRARALEQSQPVPESVYVGALERIERESGRLNELIGQLLELTRLESLAEGNHVSESGACVALDEIVAEVVADAQFEAHNRSCGVEVVKNQPCSLIGIRPLLHSAIENVVRNAVRYTDQGTNVQVSLSVLEANRSKEDGRNTALLQVRDFGPGVPEETLSLLFRPFYRVASGRDRQSGGVGLGLAIAERALRVHGATVEADNAPGGGLIMKIQIPIEEATEEFHSPLTPLSTATNVL